MCVLGYCFRGGIDIGQYLSKAIECLSCAAGVGNVDAMCILGFCFENGVGVKQDLSKAMELLEQAADLGNATAKRNLEELISRL